MFIKTVVCVCQLFVKMADCHSSFVSLGGQTQDCLDLLNINQLHFISCSAVLHCFCHSFSFGNDTFLACLVARFIAGSHFVAMCTCSDVCVPHSTLLLENINMYSY